MQKSLPMKLKYLRSVRLDLLTLLVLLIMGLAGCASTQDPLPPSGEIIVPKIVLGDIVTVTVSDIIDPPPPQEKPIKDDGTISLPQIGSVMAVGKTPGQLEDEIWHRYVPAYYTHCTITVKTTGDRVYFVRGEVHTPNRYLYTGPITVSKAIASANDFTDFADRKHLVLIREGKRYHLNYKKILSGEAPDPAVYPGDEIVVPRSWL